MKRFLFLAFSSLLVLGACKSLDSLPSSVPLGLVTISTGDAASVHMTSPTAYFVNAVNVSIPNSAINADTCGQTSYPGTAGVTPLPQITAGNPVTVALSTDTAFLSPAVADTNGYIIYKLPFGDSTVIVPGSTGHFSIAGVSNGFDAFDFAFTNADSLKLGPISSNPDSTHDQTVTWNPQIGPNASVVIQFEYGATANTINSQVLCQFTDNGSHAVQASLINLWRAANFKKIHAYRFLTSFNNNGSQEVGIVSTYSTDSTVILP